MKFIKRFLYMIFNRRVYFRIVSRSFFLFYFSGLLKVRSKFKMHYFVRDLISKGTTIIDIGANLGYYTRIFSKATGPEGFVWAVEPVPLYREILESNVRNLPNVIIVPYALGDSESEQFMGIPGKEQYRHGLTRILDNEPDDNLKIRVNVRTPESLFSRIEKVDYIKCDIEGYENKVIPGFRAIFERDKPVVQIELDPENRDFIDDFFSGLGFISYIPVNKGLRPLSRKEKYTSDILYIHKDKINTIQTFIN